MKLLDLSLENFQAAKNTEISPKAQDVNIYGDNATGKTTIGNALLWLLTGKSITGATGYDPKPYGPDGKEIHNLDTAVEGAFELDDGRMLTLKRVQRENWRKKRGSQTSEYTGNVTDYYIDGVPAKEKDYIDRIEAICPLDRIPLLMLPRYFATSVPWKDRREMLLDVCGDVSDEDVISSSIELAKELPMYLAIPGTSGQRYTVDQYREKAAATMKRINDDIKMLPARIDEAAKAAPELTEDDKAILAGGNEGLLKNKKWLESDIATLKRGGDGAIAAQIEGLERKLSEEKATAYKKQSEDIEEKRKVVNELRTKQDDIRRKSNELTREGAKLLSDAMEKEQLADRLRRDFMALANERVSLGKECDKITESTYDGDTICPACGQALPADQIEAATAAWNVQRSKKLEQRAACIKDIDRQKAEINERGIRECGKDVIAALRKQGEAKHDEADSLVEQSLRLNEQIAAAQNAVVEAGKPIRTDRMDDITDQIAALRKQGDEADEPTRRQIEAKEADLVAVQGKLDAYATAANKDSQRRQQDKRIDELKSSKKELAAEYEKQERGVYLCEQFTRAKVQMLDERINSRFHSVRFQLFENQINGGLKDCCNVMVPSEGALVKYTDGNNAGQISAGIEIIDTLAAHWGASLPIIFDNGESVQISPNVSSQVIQLIVPQAWEKLTPVAKEAMIKSYKSEAAAREAYEAPNKQLRVEIVPKNKKECA